MRIITSFPTPPPSEGAATPSPDRDVPAKLRWWNVNVPREDWSDQCPVFLLRRCEKDIGIMATKDDEYPLVGWEEAKRFVESGRINLFGRSPSTLRRYAKYMHDLTQEHGSVLEYMQHERLQWPSIRPSGDAPFTNGNDYRIVYNDWPYALDPDIKHLIVWMKFTTPEDPETGYLTQESKDLIEEFVTKTFCATSPGQSSFEDRGVSRDHLIWFKNWKSLRSVPALEHFHVMLYKPSPAVLHRLTDGDVAMSDRLAS